MKKFLLGLIVGFFLTLGLYFILATDTRLHVDVGRLLDEDIIYLKDGGFIRGSVIDEGKEELLIETAKGNFTLPRSSCKDIAKNVLLRYVRQMM